MSIYATVWSLDTSDHEASCASMHKTAPGEKHTYILCGETEDGDVPYTNDPTVPCDCEQFGAPLIYQGSHVLPATDDKRGGGMDVAYIPDHITRDGRDDAPEGSLKHWLRLSVDQDPETYGHSSDAGYATVVLERRQVEGLRDTLTRWLEREGDS